MVVVHGQRFVMDMSLRHTEYHESVKIWRKNPRVFVMYKLYYMYLTLCS